MREEKNMETDLEMLVLQELLPSQVHTAGWRRVQQENGSRRIDDTGKYVANRSRRY
jgi:hypothetical protein